MGVETCYMGFGGVGERLSERGELIGRCCYAFAVVSNVLYSFVSDNRRSKIGRRDVLTILTQTGTPPGQTSSVT